jgi:glyoxylase-like metal-dependent hydrolase (beta-lactamase superfamily II)
VRAAEAEKVRIEHITETHIHADYLSGSRELARAHGRHGVSVRRGRRVAGSIEFTGDKT